MYQKRGLHPAYHGFEQELLLRGHSPTRFALQVCDISATERSDTKESAESLVWGSATEATLMMRCLVGTGSPGHIMATMAHFS